MIKRHNPRLAAEQSQIRSILNDFKKIKTKCKEHSDGLGIEMPNENLYKNTERSTLMKMQLLDLSGIVQLKNNLVKTLSDLFDLERELLYKQQKQETRTTIQPLKKKQNLNIRIEEKMSGSPMKTGKLEKSEKQLKVEDSFYSESASIISEIMRQRVKFVDIPIYKSQPETNQSKLDRISKYIASLKKNLKSNAEAAGNKWRLKDYLLQEPSFLKMKELLEKYMMRQQELDTLINLGIKNRLKKHFDHCEIQKTNDEYRQIKIYKACFQKLATAEEQAEQVTKEDHHKQPIKKESKYIQTKVAKDFYQIKQEVQKKNENYSQLVSKISEAVEKGNQKLKKIRQKRKKIFGQDDQIWDQL